MSEIEIANVGISELLSMIEELLNAKFSWKGPKNWTNDIASLHSQENLRDAANFTSIDPRISSCGGWIGILWSLLL